MSSLLQHIQNFLAELRKSERKVGEWVLSNNQTAIQLSITDLARQADVSEPTVLRFCRSIGCQGYQDFKLKLAQSLVSQPKEPTISTVIRAEDNSETLKEKIFKGAAIALQNAQHDIDASMLDEAIATILGARRVGIFGFGASGVVAQDALHKMFRLSIPAIACMDSHMQSMTALMLSQGDVMLAISRSGRTKEIIESVKLAKNAGATVIGITSRGTPLAKVVTLGLTTTATNDTELYTPMISRLVHLSIIDALAIGIAIKRKHTLSEHLSRVKEASAVQKIPARVTI
ncbi:SIS domain-containing protein [Piscirickettsia litoralis]|uniref:Sugar isomerase n=1 Tax=Piscirickettsia litoralis TaxID=1891921 RepID=A0ABX3A2S1_9GAMM|nr:SIS domain-containing protein [Piscirickettsia litoralis]ODN43167.1 sugar isomerase [Piscirickettsia litoralis]